MVEKQVVNNVVHVFIILGGSNYSVLVEISIQILEPDQFFRGTQFKKDSTGFGKIKCKNYY